MNLLLATALIGSTQFLDVSVLELATTDVEPQVASAVTELLAAELAKFPSVRVGTRAELERKVAEAASRQLAGCDVDADCEFDLAVLRERPHVVFGALQRIGDSLTLTASWLDVGSAKILARTTQRFDGDPSRVLAATQTAAFNLVSAVRGEGASVVTLSTVESIQTAQRSKSFDAWLGVGGASYAEFGGDEPLVTRPGFSLRLGADKSLTDNWLLGVGVGFDRVTSTVSSPSYFGDIDTGSAALNDLEATTTARTLSALARLTYRRAFGLVLPYLSGGVGLAHHQLDLGAQQLVPRTPDDVLPIDTSLTFVERESPSGIALAAEFGGGAHILFARHWGVFVDARVWGSLFAPEYESVFVTSSARGEPRVTQAGYTLRSSLLVGVLFQL